MLNYILKIVTGLPLICLCFSCVTNWNQNAQKVTQIDKLFEEVKVYATELEIMQGITDPFHKECLTSRWRYTEDSTKFLSERFKSERQTDKFDTTLMSYRLDRIFLVNNILVLSLNYSTPLNSNFCRVTINKDYLNLFLDINNFNIVYSSEHSYEPEGLNWELLEQEREISWVSVYSKRVTFEQAKDSLALILRDQLLGYQGIKEGFLDGDSINRLLMP